MMTTLQYINHAYRDFLSKGDPRVASWPLMQSPFPATLLIVCYVYFVKVSGPEWMKNRKAFDLRYLMVVYNFAMVGISGWIFLTIGKYGWFDNYSLRCQPVDYSTDPHALRMAEIGWWFYVTKFIEFADTIFFVLRKKSNHISALHVIHHSLVPFSLWFGIKFAPGGYNSFFPFLNSLVHVIMYTYYGLAALGPRFKRFLGWKKYMTTIQMGQFVLVVLYLMQLRWLSNCEISNIFIYMNIFHAMLFLLLFLNFFRKAYKRHHPSARSPVSTKSLKSETQEANSFQRKNDDWRAIHGREKEEQIKKTIRHSGEEEDLDQMSQEERNVILENNNVMKNFCAHLSPECKNCGKCCDAEAPLNGDVFFQSCNSSNILNKRKLKINNDNTDFQGISEGNSTTRKCLPKN